MALYTFFVKFNNKIGDTCPLTFAGFDTCTDLDGYTSVGSKSESNHDLSVKITKGDGTDGLFTILKFGQARPTKM
jgi:hypothetical protein